MIGYSFRDKAGNTWHQVTKTTARKAYDAGQAVTICAANLRPGFPWYPEVEIEKDHMEEINAGPVPFDRIVNQYEAHNCYGAETGKYARFYAMEA